MSKEDVNVDELTNQLDNIFLEQVNVIKHFEDINKAETDTLKKIEKAKARASARGPCPFIIGDTLRIYIAYATNTE